MQKIESKTMAILIVTILLTSMAIALVDIPTASAGTKTTYPVIGATPNPVGVGQQTLILIGITEATASSLYRWEDLKVSITRPDGTNETIGPYKTDATGMTGAVYTPTMIGNYSLQLHFPEQVVKAATTGTPNGTVMLASDSKVITLVVQQEPVQQYPGQPLPSEYWTRPVDDQLREWLSIDGNWLTTPPNFLAFGNGEAPETAHILVN